MENDQFVTNPKKCHFYVREVEFCGFKSGFLGQEIRRPAPGKLMAIENWEPPKTVCKLRAFLGFTNYYSSFIKNYAKILAPLMEQLRVGREEGKKGSQKRIEWGAEQ